MDVTAMAKVNGEFVEICPGDTVSSIVSRLGFTDSRIAVELNGDICPRSNHPTQEVRPGDVMEIVSFVGGG